MYQPWYRGRKGAGGSICKEQERELEGTARYNDGGHVEEKGPGGLVLQNQKKGRTAPGTASEHRKEHTKHISTNLGK